MTLQQEEYLYGRVIRQSAVSVDPTTGIATPNANVQGPSHQPFDVSGLGTHTVVSGSQGTRIAVRMLMLYNAGDALTINLLDGAAKLMGPLAALGGGVGLFLPWSDEPYFTLSPGSSFGIDLSGALGPGIEVTGFLKYSMVESSA